MSLRDQMPETAAFIDAMRDIFGKDEINAQIRKGMGGLPDKFHAVENGHEVGTPFPDYFSVSGDALMTITKVKNAN